MKICSLPRLPYSKTERRREAKRPYSAAGLTTNGKLRVVLNLPHALWIPASMLHKATTVEDLTTGQRAAVRRDLVPFLLDESIPRQVIDKRLNSRGVAHWSRSERQTLANEAVT
jgi:hypothetical protein